MTTTHDLPTVAGWWRGRDIDWREKLDPDVDRVADDAQRAGERARLWAAMLASGAAHGAAPEVDEPGAVVDAAVTHVGGSACDLMILPVEDLLGVEEQPNLPNTVEEHPNWRRRLPARLLDQPDAQRRLRMAMETRQ